MAYAHPSGLGTLLATAHGSSNPCRRYRLRAIIAITISIGGWQWTLATLLLALDR